MGVHFSAKGVSQKKWVELSNGSARIVLRLLGLRWTGSLQGSTSIERTKRKLAGIGITQFAAALESNAPDSTVSADSLSDAFTEIRTLVFEAERAGTERIEWK